MSGDKKIYSGFAFQHPVLRFVQHEINGTAEGDSLWGGNGRDVIWAGAGNDIIHGAGGNDRILGEQGNDVILLQNVDAATIDADDFSFFA